MLKTSRKLHLWISLLFAPSLIFFAFTGVLMMLGIGESSAALSKLSEVHKIQSIDERPARTGKRAEATPAERVAMRDEAAPTTVSDAPAKPAAAPAPTRASLHRSWPLIAWFVALAAGLVASVVFGVYLAFAYKRERKMVLGILAAGVVIPLLLAFL